MKWQEPVADTNVVGRNQGKQQRLEPTVGTLVARGVLAVIVYFHGCWALPQTHGKGGLCWESGWSHAGIQLEELASCTGQWQKTAPVCNHKKLWGPWLWACTSMASQSLHRRVEVEASDVSKQGRSGAQQGWVGYR